MALGAIPIIGSAIAGATPMILNISSKTSKFYGKYGNTSLGQASQFGLGYGLSTNVGYNLSSHYITGQSNRQSSFNRPQNLNLSMAYGYRNYGRSRKIRVWSRRYRRYIWVYPRRRY